MARFYKKFWRRGSKNRGIFGGKIASQEEVRKLNKRIEAHEEAEMEEFEKDFDEQLKNL